MKNSNKLTDKVFSTSASRQPWLEADREEAILEIELAAYHLGMLPKEHIGEAEGSLNQHASHLAELTLLDNYLSDLEDELPPAAVPEASPTWWEQVDQGIRVLIANLVSPMQAESAFALLGNDNGQKMYEADDVEVMINVEEDDNVPNRKELVGLIMGLEPEGVMAHLWQASPLAEVSAIEVDEFGNFIMPALESGHYELILTNDETEIHIPNIKI